MLKLSGERQNVAKAVVLGGDPMNGGSYIHSPGLREFATPVFNPRTWADFLFHNARLRECVNRLSRVSVGLGVSAVPAIPATEYRALGRNKKNEVDLAVAKLAVIINRPNNIPMPLTEVMRRVVADYLTTGNGFLQIDESDLAAGAPIISLRHLPCVDIRVSYDGNRFVRLLSNGKHIYFRRLGDLDPKHAYINRYSGEFSASPLKMEERGTALIHFKSYCMIDDYYGEPTAASAYAALMGTYYAGLRNMNYLRNNADSTLAIIVKNGNLSADSKEQLQLMVTANAAGVANAGRALVLEPDMHRASPTGQMDISVQSLKARNGDDGSHLEYSNHNNAQVSELFGYDASNGGTARSIAAARQVVQEQTVQPLSDMFKSVLDSLLAERLSGGKAAFKFKSPTNMDVVQMGVALSRVKDALTVNDIRTFAAEMLNADLPDLPEKVGGLPMGVLTQLASLLKALAAQDATGEAEVASDVSEAVDSLQLT